MTNQDLFSAARFDKDSLMPYVWIDKPVKGSISNLGKVVEIREHGINVDFPDLPHRKFFYSDWYKDVKGKHFMSELMPVFYFSGIIYMHHIIPDGAGEEEYMAQLNGKTKGATVFTDFHFFQLYLINHKENWTVSRAKAHKLPLINKFGRFEIANLTEDTLGTGFIKFTKDITETWKEKL